MIKKDDAIGLFLIAVLITSVAVMYVGIYTQDIFLFFLGLFLTIFIGGGLIWYSREEGGI